MGNVILELIWIRDLLTQIGFPPKRPMRLYGDNKRAIHIAENRGIEVDCRLVRTKLEEK